MNRKTGASGRCDAPGKAPVFVLLAHHKVRMMFFQNTESEIDVVGMGAGAPVFAKVRDLLHFLRG